MDSEVRAYAKLVGPGWVYYMTQPKIILGRGGNDVNCDVIISSQQAVSRRHFSIRFAPELQAFEVENLSKNGILLNGEFLHRNSPPVLLRSQAHISFARIDDMCISFILPVGPKTSLKKRELARERKIPLFQWIGEAITMHTILNPSQIYKHIDDMHPNQLHKLGPPVVVRSSIRHLLTQNDHIFFVHDSTLLENKKGPVTNVELKNGKVTEAYFGIRPEHRSRFYVYVSRDELLRQRERAKAQEEGRHNLFTR